MSTLSIMARALIVLALVSLGATRHAAAQGGRAAGIVLELPASARALALGDAYVALGADDAAIFYNPAQLAAVPSVSAGVSAQRFLAETTLGALSAAARVGPGVIGFGLLLLDYGAVPEMVPDPAAGGERGIPTGASVSAAEYAASLAYAMSLGRSRVGVAGKLLRQRVAAAAGGAAAFDIGIAVDVWSAATLGAALQNIGGPVSVAQLESPLPRQLRVGAALPARRVGPLELLGTVELTHTRGAGAEPAAGAEASWTSTHGIALIGRLGALRRAPGSTASPLLAGGGIRAEGVALDYAYQSFGAIGGTHRVGVRWWQ